MRIKLLLIACLLPLVSACTARGIYENTQRNHVLQCQRAPSDSAREECEQGADLSYDEYKRVREELVNPD